MRLDWFLTTQLSPVPGHFISEVLFFAQKMREISDTLQIVFALVGVAISVTALGNQSLARERPEK